MASAAKPSEQPRTKSCVAAGNGRCIALEQPLREQRDKNLFVIAAVPAFHKMPSAAYVADRQIAATACRALAAPSASFVTAIERAGDLGRAHNGALLFNTFCADLRTFCAGRRATAGAAAGVPAAASIQSK